VVKIHYNEGVATNLGDMSRMAKISSGIAGASISPRHLNKQAIRSDSELRSSSVVHFNPNT
jgi:hypothetical protein